MATVTKDFRIKSGLVVEGTNATVNGSDIITEDIITGGQQENITVTYDPQSKVLNFVAENGVADSNTNQLAEGTDNTAPNGGNNLYFTTERARESISVDSNGPLTYDSSTGQLDVSVSRGLEVDSMDGQLKVLAADGISFDMMTQGVTLDMDYIEQELGDASQTLTVGQMGTLEVNLGAGLEAAMFDGKVQVNTGFGLTIDEVDQLAVNPGYGINNTTGVVAVDRQVLAEDLSGKGLEYDSLGGKIDVNPGNGLEINNAWNGEDFDNEVRVKTNELNSGLGFEVDGSLKVKLVGGDLSTDVMSGEIGLSAANFSPGTFGSGTEIPIVTVDSKGRVTEVTTSTVATDLLIAGNSGVDTVSLLSDTLTFTGGNGIITEVTENTVNFTADTDVMATKVYVDSVAQGLDVKESVRVATTSDINVFNGPSLIDGVSLVSGDRVLVKNQTEAVENGIYVAVLNEGIGKWELTRADDADEPDELNAGTFVFVEEGTIYDNTGWVVSSNNPLVIGTDPLVWTQFSGAGTYVAGYGLILDGSEFSVDNGVIASQINLTDAVTDLTTYVDGFLNSDDGTVIEYIDQQDATTLVAANEYTNTLVATGDATATPTYLALDINSVAKQVAASSTSDQSTAFTIYEFDAQDYRSAKFLVKLANGTHTQVSEILLTLDTSGNIAITEYAVVGTNGNLGELSATFTAADTVRLTLASTLICNVTVMGTLLV